MGICDMVGKAVCISLQFPSKGIIHHAIYTGFSLAFMVQGARVYNTARIAMPLQENASSKAAYGWARHEV